MDDGDPDRYRTTGARFLAGVIDTLVLSPLVFLDERLLAPDQSSWVIISWCLVSYSSLWVYTVVFHARYGRTIGKKLCGLKVLDVDEERIPSWGQALLRDIGIVAVNTLAWLFVVQLVLAGAYSTEAVAEGLIGQTLAWAAFGWFLLELLTMLTNDKRRALHDYIAGTVVVRSR